MIDPGTYLIKGESEINKAKGKGFNFGTPRDKMKNTLRNNMHSDNQVGPNNYNDHEKYLNDSR